MDHKAACFKLWCVVAACPAGQPGLLVVVLNTFRYSRYLLVPERNAIHLVLHAEAQPRDMVQAYLQVRETLAPACSNYRTQGEHQAVPYQYYTVMACCWTCVLSCGPFRNHQNAIILATAPTTHPSCICTLSPQAPAIFGVAHIEPCFVPHPCVPAGLYLAQVPEDGSVPVARQPARAAHHPA